MNNEESQALRLRAALELLEPHFDCIQIFANAYDPTTEQTNRVEIGAGNWFARRGHVAEWMLRGDELDRMQAIGEASEGDEDEDGDAGM